QCSGLNQLHLHVFEPCLSQQARKAWAYVWIGAAELHRLGVPLDEPPEGGAVRFSEVATEVDVFDDGHAAHASVAAQRRDQSPGGRRGASAETAQRRHRTMRRAPTR